MITLPKLRAIDDLEFTAIKLKLTHADAGEGWTAEHTDAVECEYRRFLHLTGTFPNEQIMPQSDVDVFWHYHILDTMKYASDCEAVFGYFLHHFPYIGLGGADDVENNHRIGERTRQLYEQTFGKAEGLHATAYCAVTGKAAARTVDKSTYCAATSASSYCAATSPKTNYCAAGATKSSYCAVAAAKQRYCAAGVAKAGYCAAGVAKAAYCAAVAATASYCAAQAAETAYCAAGNAAHYAVSAADPTHAACREAA
jgi:hypothetical protein